ncbi:type II toxin-antitoxin system HipA family toxin [Noviherbaspirillum saxi]|uniref:Type II toxin-antitoxin system HipA family toxin n=1 Tax=Noviherbaspirillum saxi TaxID=2320863 RepID=A0A3A3G782_9BURK|nr:type II toxin-antitoxin system HipA family toxin [Noviherbaspirillum saxi]RJF96050.1 type II toxin-antitoxin system HipA family toxin [Noviherbaspirillum saxi]
MMLVWVNRREGSGDDHIVAGAIDRAAEKRFVFTYDLKCESHCAVSLTMPVETESYIYDELHPVFQMNLPEGDLRRTIMLRFSKAISGFDDLNMLDLVGSSQIGRLRYSNEQVKADVPPQSIKEILHTKDTEGLLHYLMERYSAVSGVSGVQPKVLVRDEDKPAMQGRITASDATHIVKTFDPKEFPELATNEFFCMQVAKRAGLRIPKLQLSDNGRFLVVDRFDRKDDGRYVGFEDFCSLNGVGTARKYDSSYEQLARRIGEYVDTEHKKQAMEEFFTSFVVSCAVQNGDAHLKNFGVLYDNADAPVSFAPTYDIVSTTPYITHDTLALTLGGSKRFPNARKLHDFGRVHCGLANDHISQIVERVADAMSATRADIRQYMGDRPEFRKAGERLLACWETGLNTTLTSPPPKPGKAVKPAGRQG